MSQILESEFGFLWDCTDWKADSFLESLMIAGGSGGDTEVQLRSSR